MTDGQRAALRVLQKARHWVTAGAYPDIPIQSFISLAKKGLAIHRYADRGRPAAFRVSERGRAVDLL